MTTELSLAVLAVDYAELSRSIGMAALRAERLGAVVTAQSLVEAGVELIDSLAERYGRELNAVRMELAKAEARDAD